MKNIQLKNYLICIGVSLIERVHEYYQIQKYSQAFIITDEVIKPILLEKLRNAVSIKTNFIVLSPGEKEKNIDNIQKIWGEMRKVGCDRKTLVINLGGGVISDIGGFAASTYMRGVDFINIPTTLLAQVDASVGGKTGINFSGIKNLIGTFDQPKAVIIDTAVLTTLPKREFISGFAEIIKHGLIKDKKFFKHVTSKHPQKFSQQELIDIIARSCEIKAAVVESDEKESGERKLLNFGHTVGHAIEALSLETNMPLLHGEAISIGMIVEAKISELLNMITPDELKNIQETLKNAGLPTTILAVNIERINEKMQHDKKNEKGSIKFVLLKTIGEAVHDQEVPEDIIVQSIRFVNQ